MDSNQALHTPFSRRTLPRAPWVISSLLSLVLIIVSAGLTLGLPPRERAQGEPPDAITVTPTSLRFGYQREGTSSPSRHVLITSVAQQVSIRSISVTGDDSGHFILSGGGAGVLHLTRTIRIAFHPKLQGKLQGKMYRAALTIDGHFLGSPYRVPLLGTTLNGPVMNFSPKELVFGPQEVGTQSAPRTVIVTSIGGSDLRISRVYVSPDKNSPGAGDFRIVAQISHSTVAFGDISSFSIVFTPSSRDRRVGILTFDSNTSYPHPNSMALVGWATPRR
jgi:hypothetical protein